jgi:hypothetical protein
LIRDKPDQNICRLIRKESLLEAKVTFSIFRLDCRLKS